MFEVNKLFIKWLLPFLQACYQPIGIIMGEECTTIRVANQTACYMGFKNKPHNKALLFIKVKATFHVNSNNLNENLPLCHVAVAWKCPIFFCCSQSGQTFQSQRLSAKVVRIMKDGQINRP